MSRLVYCVVALVFVVGLAGSLPLAAKDQGPAAAAMAAASPDITTGFSDVGIFVGWDRPKDLNKHDIIQFHIWRDNIWRGNVGFEQAPVLVVDPTTFRPKNGFDSYAVDEPVSRSLTYLAADLDHMLVQMETTAPGITIGQAHRYWITCLYRRRHAHTFSYWETESVYAGQATCLNRPEPDFPGGVVTSDYVDLTNITFRWRGSVGADQYVIEVSPTPDFLRDQTWVGVVYQPTAADLELFNRTYTNVLRDAATGLGVPELLGVPPGGTLYWRVGARNSLDRPGPYPAGPSPQLDGPKNTRYIYCDISQYHSFVTPPGPPHAVAMAGKSPDITSAYGEGGILVAWDNPIGIRTDDIIEFHIWRDSLGSGIDQGGINCGPVMTNDAVTAPGVSGPMGSFDHAVVDTEGSRQLGYSVASIDHSELAAASCDEQGLTVGIPHQYWVTCLYKRHTTSSDGKDVITYWETEGTYAGRATYLRRPEPDAPGSTVTTDYVDLTNVTFRWRGSGGADQYCIEMSSDPTFQRDRTWVDVIYQPTSTDLQLFAKTYSNVLKDASTGQVVPELASVPAGGTLYWRVGARNSLDRPGPYPAGPSPQLDGSKNTRYIYCDMSQYFSFLTLPDGPPPPPDDGGGGGDDPPPPPPL